MPEDVKEALRKAWADHMVLLFRGQNLDDDQLLAASGIFGPPHDAASRKYHLDVGHEGRRQLHGVAAPEHHDHFQPRRERQAGDGQRRARQLRGRLAHRQLVREGAARGQHALLAGDPGETAAATPPSTTSTSPTTSCRTI